MMVMMIDDDVGGGNGARGVMNKAEGTGLLSCVAVVRGVGWRDQPDFKINERKK